MYKKEGDIRKAGILLHITSLPGDEPIGTLGKEAHKFLELLSAASQRSWQILPIHPTAKNGNPFEPKSVFAGNPFFINLEKLVEKGDLELKCYQGYLDKCNRRSGDATVSYVDYAFLARFKPEVLPQSFAGFSANKDKKRISDYERFLERNEFWINDYAGSDKRMVDFRKYEQFVFDEQMIELHQAANSKGIELIGDMPIYPAYDSLDVLANKELFQLDNNVNRTSLPGVPPDDFSVDGQLWEKSVLYKWGSQATEKENHSVFEWWCQRIRRLLGCHDVLRIDHFRAFESYGTVSPLESDARNAEWIPGPGKKFFDYIRDSLGEMPFIAEDLGTITPAVRELLARLGFPGMNVLLFADPLNKDHIYLPHNAKPNSVSYTGTHDNETMMQSIYETMDRKRKKAFLEYLGQSTEKEANWQAIDLLYNSSSNRVIIPMQDILALGKKARMNAPGTTNGNWRWRMTDEQSAEFSNYAGPHLEEISKRHNRNALSRNSTY